MKKYERLILITIVAKFMGMALSPMVVQLFLPQGYLSIGASFGVNYSMFLSQVLVLVIENVGIAYWLFEESKSGLWTFFGAIFGIPGLIAYYIVLLAQKK